MTVRSNSGRDARSPGGAVEGPRGAFARSRIWLLAGALVVATALVYKPAWRGELLWDDRSYLCKEELRSPAGLYRIWFQVGATLDYYPLLHSAFWLQHMLWGDATLGYHWVNIVLHALTAFLAWLVLRRLEVPGAYLAAAIFALHPVHVESVAWISELKNTLSGACYAGAVLAYLRFDETRKWRAYALAAALFVLGLLSKNVTVTLPAAMLVILWWKRGRLSLKRDVLPLAPIFALGMAFGLLTIWVEKDLLSARGAELEFTAIQRCLIAGRAFWFYLGKLLAPVLLAPIYPRWNVSQAVWWQYLFPASAIALLGVLWALRRRARGPLAAVLFFAVVLSPAMGFVSFSYFRHSFVADHFQYLPSLGIISLFSAGLVLAAGKLQPPLRRVAPLAAGMLLVVLGVLSGRQSRLYERAEDFYKTTVERNDGAWMANYNLGVAYTDQNRLVEAAESYRRVLAHRPDHAEAHGNLAVVLSSLGEYDEAVAHCREAIRCKPDSAQFHSNLGRVLAEQGKWAQAIESYNVAVRLNPDLAVAHDNAALAHLMHGNLDQAVRHLSECVRLQPDSARAQDKLGAALARQGKFDAAVSHLRRAVELDRQYVPAHCNLAWLLATEPTLAGDHAQEAVRIAERASLLTERNAPVPLDILAAAYANAGRFPEAIQTAERALRLATDSKLTQRASEIRSRLELYRAGSPCRRPATASRPAAQ